jgi:uncharacterized Zn-binding protein involved in type VI secretion
MLAAGLDVHHLDSTVLGKTVEWSSVDRKVFLTTRAGTPPNVLQVTLYQLGNDGLPGISKIEIGYAYLQFLNEHNGGRSDSAMMRFTLFTMPQSGPSAVADWVVWRLPADTACGQCATISAALLPTTPGGRFVYLTIPYQIPLNGDGAFTGSSYGAGFDFVHSASLPGPTSTTASAGWAFNWQGDSVRTTSGPLQPSGGVLVGDATVTVNGQTVATVSRRASGITARDPSGRSITNQTDARALARLFAVPADIAYYVEWPTFVIFFCGC